MGNGRLFLYLTEPLDTIHHYQTPEGIELSLSLAGPMPRGIAWFIDSLIRFVGYIIIAIVLSFLGGAGEGLILIGIFIIEWFYPVFFEVHNGMTPGKKVMDLQVVHDDGTPVSWTSSILRNFIRTVDFLPFLNITGLVAMLLNARFKRLGDFAAGTIVVYTNNKSRKFTIPKYDSSPAPVPLKLEEQRLILDFCERATKLSAQRRRELASLLLELTDNDAPENRLLAYGNWFLKGKSP